MRRAKDTATEPRFVAAVVLSAYASAKLSTGLGIGVGTEPAVPVASTWDLFPSPGLVTS